MNPSLNSYIPALGYRWLTRFYDPVVRVTTREATFKEALLQQANLQDGYRILDLGCGTGTLAMMAKRTRPNVEVFGLDADPEALKLARTKLEGLASRPNWIKDWRRHCRTRLNRLIGPSQACFFITCLQS